MPKIITGDVHTYVKQLISETMGFKDTKDSVPENFRNYPPKEEQQGHKDCFKSSDNERKKR